LAWFDPRITALVIGLLGSTAASGPELPAVAVVSADVLEVFDEPTIARSRPASSDAVMRSRCAR